MLNKTVLGNPIERHMGQLIRWHYSLRAPPTADLGIGHHLSSIGVTVEREGLQSHDRATITRRNTRTMRTVY